MHQGAARNKGLNKATGNYVFFLDTDDTIKLIEYLTELKDRIGPEHIEYLKNRI